jgi:hypothetical protein
MKRFIRIHYLLLCVFLNTSTLYAQRSTAIGIEIGVSKYAVNDLNGNNLFFVDYRPKFGFGVEKKFKKISLGTSFNFCAVKQNSLTSTDDTIKKSKIESATYINAKYLGISPYLKLNLDKHLRAGAGLSFAYQIYGSYYAIYKVWKTDGNNPKLLSTINNNYDQKISSFLSEGFYFIGYELNNFFLRFQHNKSLNHFNNENNYNFLSGNSLSIIWYIRLASSNNQ